MDQELHQDRILHEELQAVDDLSFTHDKLFCEVFQWIELVKVSLRFVIPKSIRWRLDLDALTNTVATEGNP